MDELASFSSGQRIELLSELLAHEMVRLYQAPYLCIEMKTADTKIVSMRAMLTLKLDEVRQRV